MRPYLVRAVVFLAPAAAACGEPVAAPNPDPEPEPVVIETANFTVVDRASTASTTLEALGARLEHERERVAAFFSEFLPPDRITFTVRAGTGIPYVNPGDNTMTQWSDKLDFDYIPHQLTHLWTRYTRRAFLEEGIAVYVTEQLLPESRTVNPYRGQSPDAWVSLFEQNGARVSLFSAFRASNFSYNFQGSESDAFAWQIFVQAGSFTGWVIDHFGRDEWFRLFQTEDLSGTFGATAVDLERSWLQTVQVAYPTPLPCADALGEIGSREEFWCARAAG